HRPCAGFERCSQEDLGVAADLGPNVHAQPLADRRHRTREVTDASAAAPDVVEVLAVTGQAGVVELVQTGATSEDQLVTEVGVLRYLDDEPGKDQVLLDLVAADPGDDGGPVRELGRGDHTSGSISRFTMRRHR